MPPHTPKYPSRPVKLIDDSIKMITTLIAAIDSSIWLRIRPLRHAFPYELVMWWRWRTMRSMVVENDRIVKIVFDPINAGPIFDCAGHIPS